MIVTPIKTPIVHAGEFSLEELISQNIDKLQEKVVVAVSSKVVSLCENNTVPLQGTNKEELIKQQSDYYLDKSTSSFGYHFTIKNNTLISASGIDESNSNNTFTLWPNNPQKTANELRVCIKNKFKIKNVGVIITDSSSMPPLRRGTIGIMLAHSGFTATNDKTGQKDLFNRPFKYSVAGIGSGLAAAANVVMGEGDERTPIVVISDIPFVKFKDANPTQKELKSVYLTLDNDLYGPLLSKNNWQKPSTT